MSYDEKCPRCEFDFDAEKEKDNECPNCSLPFKWVIRSFYDEDGEVIIEMTEW